MPSLHQLLAAHTTVLLIDSSSTNVQVALFQADKEPIWSSRIGEAGEQVFAAVNDTLSRSCQQLDSIDAFIFCDGPGSVLGIRTTAVALRTWLMLRERPAYGFCSLAVVAHALASAENKRDFSVICDARRDTWHHVGVAADGTISNLHRLQTLALVGALVMPDGFRHWTPLPSSVKIVTYSLPTLLPQIADDDLFYAAAEPDAFLHEEPSYKTWTPQVHRAPSLS